VILFHHARLALFLNSKFRPVITRLEAWFKELKVIRKLDVHEVPTNANTLLIKGFAVVPQITASRSFIFVFLLFSLLFQEVLV